MKIYFQVEMMFADASFRVFMVKAKTYEESCVKLAKIHGEPNAFKLLGRYETSAVDRDIINRIS